MNIEGMSTYNPEKSKKLDSNHQAEFYNLAQRHQREMAELKKRHQNEMSPHVAAAFAEATMEGGAEKEKQTTEEHKDEPNDEIKAGNSGSISKEESKAETTANQENAERNRMIAEVVNLVKTTPGIDFVACVNGGLTYREAQENRFGEQYDYFFDKDTQKMLRARNTNKSLDFGAYQLGLSGFREEESFKVSWLKTQKDGEVYFIGRIPFNSVSVEHAFTKDHRRGVHFSLALRLLNNQKTLELFKEEKTKEFLKLLAETEYSNREIDTINIENLQTKEAIHFLSQVLYALAGKYTPEYLNFYLEQEKLYKNKK